MVFFFSEVALQSGLELNSQWLCQQPAGLEVAPPSVFHGHNYIKVCNPTKAAG